MQPRPIFWIPHLEVTIWTCNAPIIRTHRVTIRMSVGHLSVRCKIWFFQTSSPSILEQLGTFLRSLCPRTVWLDHLHNRSLSIRHLLAIFYLFVSSFKIIFCESIFLIKSISQFLLQLSISQLKRFMNCEFDISVNCLILLYARLVYNFCLCSIYFLETRTMFNVLRR